MKCYRHYERDAVSSCSHCGKGICSDCYNEYGINLCESCILTQVDFNKKTMIKNSLIMLVLFFIGFNGSEGNLLFAIGFAGVPWGWSILTNITPSMFLFMSGFGWIMYFLLKLAISCFIGVFVAPYQIYKVVKEIKAGNKIKQYANSKF